MKTNALVCKTINAHNLRPTTKDASIFVPVAPPSHIAPEGYTLLTGLCDRKVLASLPDRLVTINPENGHETIIDSTEGICAAEVSDNRLLVMTKEGPKIFNRDNRGQYISAGGRPQWGPVSIEAYPMAPLTMTIDSVELSREYGPGATATRSDRERLCDCVIGAYHNLGVAAENQGVFFQPLLARIVIKDREGAVLHRGPLILIMPPEGLPFEEAISLPMAVSNTTSAISLSIPSFRLRVVCPPMTQQFLVERAASLSVEISPGFHPCDTSVAASNAMISFYGNTSFGLRARVIMSGANLGLSSKNNALNKRLLEKVSGKFDETNTTLVSFKKPYERGVNEIIGSYGTMPVDEQSKLIKKCLFAKSTAVRTDSDAFLLSRMNTPHSFTSVFIASTPKSTLYGDVSSLLYNGYTPLDYASVLDQNNGRESWIAVSTVTFSDGRTGRRVYRGTGAMPTQLSPFITYPSADATLLDIVVEDQTEGARPLRWRIELSPHPDGLTAYAVSPELENFKPYEDLNAWIMDTEQIYPAPEKHASAIVVADGRSPLVLLAAETLPSAVTAISPAESTSGAWDYGRSRFYVFTSKTLSLANVSASVDTIALSKISDIGVEHKFEFTTTPFHISYFVRDNNLYSLDGTRVKLLCAIPSDVDDICYDISDHRLLVSSLSGKDPVYHISPDTGEVCFTSSSPAPHDGALSVGAHLLMPTQSGLMDIAMAHRDSKADMIKAEIYFDVDISNFKTKKWIREVVWHIDSSLMKGGLALKRKYLADRDATVCRYDIEGRVRAPIVMPVGVRPFNGIVLEIVAEFSPDTVISTPQGDLIHNS